MLPKRAIYLDLGCGNGELADWLRRQGHSGWYIGLDFSPELLNIARQKNNHASSVFFQRDLTDPGWEAGLPDRQFDLILALAVLHHLPSRKLHHQLLLTVRNLLDPHGVFIHSEWQFLNSERLRARIQPWHAAGLNEDDVEPGDYLLDWRHGGPALRYVHHFSPEELADLADEAGFQIEQQFLSDGEGGRLGLYQVWGVKSTQKRTGHT